MKVTNIMVTWGGSAARDLTRRPFGYHNASLEVDVAFRNESDNVADMGGGGSMTLFLTDGERAELFGFVRRMLEARTKADVEIGVDQTGGQR